MTVETVDRAAWESARADVPGSFYGDPAWIESTARASGTIPLYVLVGDESAPLLRIALVTRQRAGRRVGITAPVAAYVCCDVSYPDNLPEGRREARLMEALDSFAEWCEAVSDFVDIALPPEIIDVRPFLWRGWESRHRYTYRVDLRELSEDRLRSTLRKGVRKSHDAGHELVELHSEEAVSALEATLLPTFKRQPHALPIARAYLHGYLRELCELPNVRTIAAIGGGNALATVMFGVDGMQAYDLLTGSTDEGMQSKASVSVRWEALQRAMDSVATFDFCGANLPDIAYFKRGFGGDLVPYASVRWARSGFDRWLQVSAPLLKRRVAGWLK